MFDRQFEIDDVTYIVTVASFTGPVPGRYSGDPGDCYPDECAEIEFEDKVEYARDGEDVANVMDFTDFLKAYAVEHSKGDTDEAFSDVENIVLSEILESADDNYEPSEPDYETL